MTETFRSTPAQQALVAAKDFLSLLEQSSNRDLADEGLGAQQLAIQSQLLVLNVQPDLAKHPGFAHYVESLTNTLARLAEVFGKLDDPVYLTFVRVRAQMSQGE